MNVLNLQKGLNIKCVLKMRLVEYQMFNDFDVQTFDNLFDNITTEGTYPTHRGV